MCEYAISLQPETAEHVLGAPGSEEVNLTRGEVEETTGPDARAVPALVVTGSLAEDEGTVWAQPIALLHLSVDGEPINEVVCVQEGAAPAEFAGLISLPKGRAWLCDAVARAHPGQGCELADVEDVCGAERLLDEAWLSHMRISLHR